MTSTNFGDSRWWTWIFGFWLAIVIWLVGQVVLGIGLQVFSGLNDPSVMQSTMEASETVALPSIKTIVMFALAGLAILPPIILWPLRRNFKSETGKKIAFFIAALCVAYTGAVMIYAVMSAPDSDPDLVGKLIQSHPINYALILLTFPVVAGGFWLSQKFIHCRPILSLHTAWKKFRWKRMGFAMALTIGIAVLVSVIGHITDISKAEYVFDSKRFFAYLPFTLLLIPLQSATEEIALRGYLNQGLYRYIKNPWIVFVLTSAAFASLHLSNPEVLESAGDTPLLIIMSGYFFFGLFACFLTYIDGGLESAIGMHAANNIFAASIVGYESSALPTPTLFRVGLNTELDSLVVLVSLSLICYVIYKTRAPFEKNSA